MATVTVFETSVPLTVPSFGVASTVTTSPLLGLNGLMVGPTQLTGTKPVARFSETDLEPTGAEALVFVWTMHVLVPRVTFQVQATETLLPSASAVVVEAVRLSFVRGEAGLKVGVVAVGALLAASSFVMVPVAMKSAPRFIPLPPDGDGLESVTVNVSFGSKVVSPQITMEMVFGSLPPPEPLNVNVPVCPM